MVIVGKAGKESETAGRVGNELANTVLMYRTTRNFIRVHSN